MRLTCRGWTDHLPRPQPATAQLLPHEVLMEIFGYLHPSDFDSARHTCRSWFLAGLDHRIGLQMLRSTGSYPAFL